MYKKLFIFSISLWLLSSGLFAVFFITGSTSKSTDNRRAINLSPAEKDIVLGEMRQVLKALNGTLKGLGNNDFKEASISAGSAGTAMAVDINPIVMSKLPLDFKKMGMGMHEDFDKISLDLKSGIKQGDAIKKLGEITNKCIACHSAYRLNDK